MLIRAINTNDYQRINDLIFDAFSNTQHGYNDENELVERLRLEDNYSQQLELVVTENERLLGHGLLSPIQIADNQDGLVMAPLEVATDAQRQGIGARLIKALELRACAAGYTYISVLGHAEYYPKFGYLPAREYGITAPFAVKDELFMIKELVTGVLSNVRGTLQYSDAFNL
jgi:Predicted acetyltransferase